MTEEQFRVFEWHCRASETYTEKKIPIYYKIEAPIGEMALEHFYYWESERDEDIRLGLIEPDSYKIVKIKGYDKNAPFGRYFWEYWPKHLQESTDEVDDKHHNGAFQQTYMELENDQEN